MLDMTIRLTTVFCALLATSRDLQVPSGSAFAHSRVSASQPTMTFPEATISNGLITAKVYLPDPQRGFYRSTRFDWSGMIAGLEYNGHQYYGPWFTGSDPAVRDFVYRGQDIVVSAQSGAVGPAEEFQRPQGYSTAKPGETFVKIGVGVLRKKDDTAYSAYNAYEIVDAGKWSTRPRPDSVEFSQELDDPRSGYGYVYRKTVQLNAGRPELVIEHSLQNTGRLPLDANQYNHNFLVLDRAATGPEFTITCPFPIQTTRPPDPKLAEVRANQILYLKTLEGEERVTFPIQGFGKEPKDYDVRVESRRTGAGFRVTSDRAPASIGFWSIRSVISVEPFVDLGTDPGKTTAWKYVYTYYVNSR
jgi:hypothetical protein